MLALMENSVCNLLTMVTCFGNFISYITIEARQLDTMMNAFASYHAQLPAGAAPASYRPKIGDLCSARFSEDDAWYRARVRSYQPGNMADVIFVDFGNVWMKYLLA